MASLAGMLKQRGFHVTGSDAAAYPPMSDFLAGLDIPVAQPFAARNLEPRPDMVVVGNAISRGNVELEGILDRRIPFCSLPQILHEEFLRGREVLVVAGTHGKTTTTSMLRGSSTAPAFEPSFLIGGIAENFGSSFQLGQREALHPRGRRVRHRVLRQGPQIPALFSRLRDPDFGGVRSRRYLQGSGRGRDRIQAPGQSGAAAAAALSPWTRGRASTECLAKAFCPVERYGTSQAAGWRIANLRLDTARTSWSVLHDGEPWSDFEFALAGEYNVLNATAAAALASGCGISKDQIRPHCSPSRVSSAGWKCGRRSTESPSSMTSPIIPRRSRALSRRCARAIPERRLWAILEPRSNTLRRNVFQSNWREPGVGR